jgi:glyoxylase-like metal-dependent hydrolase (beta-lactamase superfamily II)
MKVHPIQTGTVMIKTRQRAGVGRGKRRFLNMLLDRTWTEPLPILAWAIEHEEGVIVVDTGETARVAEPGYLPRWHPYYRFGVKFSVEPVDEIGPQLQTIGIDPGEVRWLVMTHLHSDHAGGLRHFPTSDVLLTRTEGDLASGWRGRLRGYLNQHYPDWFSPHLVDFEDGPLGPFEVSKKLTAAGDVHLVPVPGHTPGQMAVIVEGSEMLIFIAGDTSYTEELMLEDVIDGVSPSDEIARRTLARVRALVAERETLYLPSHDPESPRRLTDRIPATRQARVAQLVT